MDYVLIKADGDALRFTDGDIVLYGNLKEALDDVIVAEEVITFDEYKKRTQSKEHRYRYRPKSKK